jgi:hypothetical protein
MVKVPGPAPYADDEMEKMLEDMARRQIEGLPEPKPFYAGIDWGTEKSRTVMVLAQVVDGELHIIRGED